MQKVIIFGTGSTAKGVVDGLNENTEIICYSDNDKSKWGTTLNNKMIINPQEIKSMDFEYIIIASQFSNDIYNQLIKLKIDCKKIFEYFRFLDGYENNISNKIMQIDRNRDVEIISTGISYMEAAINSEYINKKIINIANHSQDLYYDYNLIKHIIENNKTELVNLKYVFIGLCYYSFEYDMSLSAMKNKVKIYYDAIGLKHNLKDENMLKRNMKLNKEIGDCIFAGKKKNKPIVVHKDRSTYINEVIGKKQAELDGNKNYPNTVKENIEIFKNYLSLLNNNNIRPIVIVCPVSQYYVKHFPNRLKEEFNNIVEEVKKEHNFQLLDYFDSDLFEDEDFYDVSHLNNVGAKKFANMLNNFIE